MKKLILLSVILLGMTVPSAAQFGLRFSLGNGHGHHRHHDQHHDRQHDRHYRHHSKQRVWVPGRLVRVWVPAQFGFRYDHHGRRVRICLSEGYYRMEREPGHWEYRSGRKHRSSRRYR